MKRIFKAFLLSVVVVGGVSCAEMRYVSKEISPEAMYDIAKFETMSRIFFIEKGNIEEHNDSLSLVARDELDRLLYSYSIPLSNEEIMFSNPLQGQFVGEEIEQLLFSIINDKRNIKHLSIPPIIKSLLVENGKRFGLIMVHTGFTRDEGNYGGQVAKSIGIAVLSTVLSMGAVTLYSEVPFKANSTLHAIIVDSENDKIVFYNNATSEAEPCDSYVLRTQINEVFKKLFW